MSTSHKCDLCHKSIKVMEKVVSITNWGHQVGYHDLCLKCWTDQSKWAQIHETKKDT